MTACSHIGLDPLYQRRRLLRVNEGKLAQNPRKNSHPTQQAAFNTHKPCTSQPFPMHHREEEERGEGFLIEDILRFGLAFSFPFALPALNGPILHSTCTRQGSASNRVHCLFPDSYLGWGAVPRRSFQRKPKDFRVWLPEMLP